MVRTMTVPLSWIKWPVVVLTAGWLIWLVQLWQPSRQIVRHTENLLTRASARDWPAVTAMMAEDYRDTWGHDRGLSVDKAREVFSHFFALRIVPLEPLRVTPDSGEGTAVARVGVFGSGTAVAHRVMDEVQSTTEPFIFTWRKAGAWPWQWELVSAAHEELSRRWRP